MADCMKCANRNNDYCIFGCENGESFKPVTKADRIRSMTDEELAEWLVFVEQRILERQPMLERPALYADWLDWLREEET